MNFKMEKQLSEFERRTHNSLYDLAKGGRGEKDSVLNGAVYEIYSRRQHELREILDAITTIHRSIGGPDRAFIALEEIVLAKIEDREPKWKIE